MAKVTRTNPQAFYKLSHALKELDGVTAKAGWFESAKYEDGTQVAYVATIQEFGAHFTKYGAKAGDYSTVIPPRPFMRPTVIREILRWTELMAAGAKAVLAGKSTASKVMEDIGLRAAADIARSITLVKSPPLKPSTIAARKRARSDKKTRGLLTKPLVDSGIMLSTVTNTVEKS